METILVSLVCIALIVFGGMTMSQGFMTSVDTSTSGLDELGQRNETIIRTLINPVSASQPAANTFEIILKNDGQIKLADFAKWDVIVHYFDETGNYTIKWLPYTENALGDDEWQVTWLRLNGVAEVFETGVFNPGEQMMITGQLNPPVGLGTTNMVVISTPSGITAQTYFSP